MKARLLNVGWISLLLMGCGQGPEAQFTLSTETTGLMKDARTAVSEQLDELFGDPQNIVAWQRLPVDFGGYAGTVAAVDGSGRTRRVKVTFEEEVPAIDEPMELVWTSGEWNLKSWTVRGYDSETGELLIDEAYSAEANGELPVHPEEGLTFVLDPGRTMKHGRQLYMTHCMHCHGVTGDGAGPTAEYLNPRPRDYRQGKFKFTSTKPQVKACRDDLARVIKYGIPGTYMPSFLLLKDEELSSIIEYVRWLSMRGELERIMSISLLGDYKDPKANPKVAADRAASGVTEESVAEALAEYLSGEEGMLYELNDEADILAQSWQDAEETDNLLLPTTPRPEMTRASVLKGKELYLGDKLKCWNCHGISGQGDGPETMAYKKNDATGEMYAIPGLHDDWGNPLKPRNLTRGIYRGGRRPIDLFRRIRAGVKGAVMPAHGEALATDEEVWHVVNYVLSVPLSVDDIPDGTGSSEAGTEVAAD